MLGDFSEVVRGTFRLLYPKGLTREELEKKAKEFNWLRAIYERFKEA
jgi:hypothetical protein